MRKPKSIFIFIFDVLELALSGRSAVNDRNNSNKNSHKIANELLTLDFILVKLFWYQLNLF